MRYWGDWGWKNLKNFSQDIEGIQDWYLKSFFKARFKNFCLPRASTKQSSLLQERIQEAPFGVHVSIKFRLQRKRDIRLPDLRKWRCLLWLWYDITAISLQRRQDINIQYAFCAMIKIPFYFQDNVIKYFAFCCTFTFIQSKIVLFVFAFVISGPFCGRELVLSLQVSNCSNPHSVVCLPIKSIGVLYLGHRKKYQEKLHLQISFIFPLQIL